MFSGLADKSGVHSLVAAAGKLDRAKASLSVARPCVGRRAVLASPRARPVQRGHPDLIDSEPAAIHLPNGGTRSL